MTRGIHDGDRQQPIVLTVPGLNGSGPSHWQTLWEQSRPDTTRIELGMWSQPRRNAWVTKIDQAIRTAKHPVVLAAHSLGCLAVAWWAELAAPTWGWPVAGALLVAPADLNARPLAAELADFAPPPQRPLPFPSILVVGEDDPWITPAAAESLAAGWGSHFVNAGPVGHINAASGLGWWEEGQELLDRVIRAAGGPRSIGEARTLLAVNGTEAASAEFLGR
jgi:predicted alpha/beta hydrolase family esterase